MSIDCKLPNVTSGTRHDQSVPTLTSFGPLAFRNKFADVEYLILTSSDGDAGSPGCGRRLSPSEDGHVAVPRVQEDLDYLEDGGK